MATSKPCSRWFAPVLALLIVVGLSGCFGKEGNRRKTFTNFLQDTVMRNRKRLPTPTADRKKQFGPFVSDYAVLYGYSQQVNQMMDSDLRPAVDDINVIRVPQDYVIQRELLRQANDALDILGQRLQNTKLQANTAHDALKQGEDLKPVFDQMYNEAVTAPAEALQPLVPAAQIFTQQLVQVGDFVAQQNTQVNFVVNDIQSPTSQQANQYSTLIGPLAIQHQTFNQAWIAAVNAAQ